MGSLEARVEENLQPLVETFLERHPAAGLAVSVVRGPEVVTRGFGIRDVETRVPVGPDTIFHLASASKPVVATAIVSMAMSHGSGGRGLDLDEPVTRWVPELTLADGRAGEVTARGLLTHTSGLPDVTDYGWHDPQLGDDALSELARSMKGWRLRSDPGSSYSYSNAGYELLGLVLSRVMGTTFESAVDELVLEPLGMRSSTFLRSEVPVDRAASPHVGMPLSVPAGRAYPYTRRHAPSSSLHSNPVELTRWMAAHFEPDGRALGGPGDPRRRLDAQLREAMAQPAVTVGEPPWDEAVSLGWGVGSYRGHRTLSHSGADPGFGSMVVVVPEVRSGVAVLANSNTVPTDLIAMAALDVALAERDADLAAAPADVAQGVAALRELLPPVVLPVAQALASAGLDAATSTYLRLAALEPPEFDLDDDGFVDAVWGAIELHRTGMVWPLLRFWTDQRPDSSAAWTMTGWAHGVDGQPELARSLLQRALALDPANEEAGQLLTGFPM